MPYKQGYHYIGQDNVYLDGKVYTCNPKSATICSYVWPDDSEGMNGAWLLLQMKAIKKTLPDVAEIEAIPHFWAGSHPDVFKLKLGDYVQFQD